FRDSDGTEFLDRGSYFDLTPLDVATDLRKRTVQYLEAMGIPVESSHHEVAPSQHEIDLRYADALTMADSIMTYRLTVKEAARERRGRYICAGRGGTGRRWCGSPCTSRARSRPFGSSSAHPTLRAIRTSRSPACCRPAWPGSRTSTTCRPKPRTTSMR